MARPAPWARAPAGRSPARAAAAPVEATRRKWRRGTAPGAAIANLPAPPELQGGGGAPRQQRRALGREAAVPDVRGHGGDVAGAHGDPRPHGAGVAILHLPL